METYLTIGLLAVVTILLVIILIKQAKSDKSNNSAEINELKEKVASLSSSLDTEFERSRRENAVSQADMRKETAAVIGEMSGKIDKLKEENSDRQSKFELNIEKALNGIKMNDIEQNEKQSKIISESLEKMKESNEKAMTSMRESNEKKLEEMRATVDEKLSETLSARLDSSFKTVSERLENVYKSLGEMKELSSGITTNVTALNRVLTNVKARGTWAEVQLGSILDQTIPGMYETNFASVDGSSDRVEFAVKIPSSDGTITFMPIDSKFPMEDYIRLCDAADSADAVALDSARKALEARVISEAKTVSKYINVPRTTPYAILYLATEGLYAEIASSRNGISEKVMAEYNIMIAGPSTITALLNSLSLGYRAVAINEKANEVRELLAAAKKQYSTFGEVLAKAKKKIEEAGKTLDEADKRNNIIVKKLNSVDEIEYSQAETILGINEKSIITEEE